MSFVEKNSGMVDINRLYDHVLSLEGIKHALDAFEALIQAAEYIETTLQQSGLATSRHSFAVRGLNKEFYNVEGILEEEPDFSKPTLVVASHFDTVYSTPGADDNASGVAVMLEVARILKELDYDKNVLFVGLNLEEFSPELQSKIREVGKNLGIYDNSFRFRSWPLKKYATLFKQRIISQKGQPNPFLMTMNGTNSRLRQNKNCRDKSYAFSRNKIVFSRNQPEMILLAEASV
ncbi:MAG: M28 family peptidase [Candidatus Hodarchaeales archaeon]|jgi:hypothetical protein